MKISYEEFNDLQEQQIIRDAAQRARHELIVLEQIVKRKDKEKITEFMQGIKEIEFEAIAKIRKMIEGGKEDEWIY